MPKSIAGGQQFFLLTKLTKVGDVDKPKGKYFDLAGRIAYSAYMSMHTTTS